MTAPRPRTPPPVQLGPPAVAYRVLGVEGDLTAGCANSGCESPAVGLDPRPRSLMERRHGCGFFYLCREHLRLAHVLWRREGSPTEPPPDILPVDRAARRRRRAAP